jgi:hypothetical protein
MCGGGGHVSFCFLLQPNLMFLVCVYFFYFSRSLKHDGGKSVFNPFVWSQGGEFREEKKKEEKTVWDVGRVLSSVDFWFLMKSSWQTNVSCSLGGAAHRLSRGDH